MTEIDITPDVSSLPNAAMRGARLLAVRFAWLLLAFLAVFLFIAGLPAMRDQQVETYQTALGFDLQRGMGGDLLVIPYWDEQAAHAGMMERDILEAVNGRPLPPDSSLSPSDLFPGQAGESVTLSIRTGQRPPRDITLVHGGENGAALARLGIPLSALTAVTAGFEIVVALIFLTVSVFIFWRRADDLSAGLASLILILVFIGVLSLPVIALYERELPWRYVLDSWISLVLAGLLLFMFLFPSGRFVPRWSAVIMLLWLAWAVLAWFFPELYFWRQEPLPYAVSMLLFIGAAIAAQVWRYRTTSNLQQKQQTKWVVWGAGVALLGGLFLQVVIGLFAEPSALVSDLLLEPAARLLELFIPITLAVAIWRYRLWDIDLIINRTLVYGGLTAAIILLYILIVGGLGALLQMQGNLLIALLATGIVAVLFQPVRERLQRGVNRLMYGERDDPLAALTELGRRLEATAVPEAVLPTIVETITQTLRLPYAAIAITGDEQPQIVASTGKAVPQPISYALTYQSARIGELLVAPRAPGETFSQADERLLRNLARQAGTAVYAVQLTEQLRRSRQRIISAREEERRRLRRDLHDGLGPQLASQSLGMEAAGKLIATDPQRAADLLRILQAQAQEAIRDVRRLVYDLRPPALDQLGLAGALQESAFRLASDRLHFSFQIADLPQLPAAVEVAALRIAQEAMTNTVRHAQATRCTVRLFVDNNNLVIEVSDNGRGLPADYEAGVGLISMRERAEELNGRCIITSVGRRGTRLYAELPL